jgi:hypothetical protein
MTGDNKRILSMLILKMNLTFIIPGGEKKRVPLVVGAGHYIAKAVIVQSNFASLRENVEL